MSRRGPRTAEGKALAARNATAHGALSVLAVVPGMETAEEWQSHSDGIVKSLSPLGTMERTLAERIALLMWRLRRVARYEASSIAVSQETVEDDLGQERRYNSKIKPGSYYPEDLRGTVQYEAGLVRLMRRFAGLPEDAEITGEAAQTLVWEFAKRAEVEEEDFDFPGVPEGDWEELDRVAVGRVRSAFQQMAKAAMRDLGEVWRSVLFQEECDLRVARYELQKVETELDRMRRHRLLPDDKTLEKVSRYEAHLSRELSRCLREFHDLQARRLEMWSQGEPGEGLRRVLEAFREGLEATLSTALPSAQVDPPAALPGGQNCETNSSPRVARTPAAAR